MKKRSMAVLLLSMMLLAAGQTVLADEAEVGNPCMPSEAEREVYIADGSYEERLAYVEALNHRQASPWLIQEALKRESGVQTFDSSVPDDRKTMPVEGGIKLLVVRVEFADVKFESEKIYAQEQLEAMVNSEEDPTKEVYPYESLAAYYKRSSYDKLQLSGDVYSYTLSQDRAKYKNKDEDLIKEVLQGLDGQIDFSEYDCDGDGVMEGVYINFAGENTGWGSTWWSHMSRIEEPGYEVDGIRPNGYIFLETAESEIWGNATLIHETGHMLGLPDYYSYEDNKFENGIATFDMMNNNAGDHNGFSKWLLGWLGKDEILRISRQEGAAKVSLAPLSDPLGEGKKIAVIAPKDEGIYSEYFVVQYEKGIGNQSTVITEEGEYQEGFRIFHVNAVLETTGKSFLYSNRNEEVQKLIELRYPPDELAYNIQHSMFRENDVLTPDTSSSSAFWGGQYMGYTGIRLTDFITGQEPSFSVDFDEPLEIDGSIELKAAPGYQVDKLTNTLDLRLESDKPLVLSDSGAAYLERDGQRIPVNMTVQRQKQVYIQYTDIDNPLKPGTDYTLVFPEGTFQLSKEVVSKEVRMTVHTSEFTEFAAVYSFPNINITTGLFSLGTGKAGMAVNEDTLPDDAIWDMQCYIMENGEEPKKTSLRLPMPEGKSSFSPRDMQAVSCYNGTAVLAVVAASDAEKVTVLYQLDENGTCISEPVMLPHLVEIFPFGNGIKASVIEDNGAMGSPGLQGSEIQDGSLKLYTVDFTGEPQYRELSVRSTGVFPVDSKSYAVQLYEEQTGEIQLQFFDEQDQRTRAIPFEKMVAAVLPEQDAVRVFTMEVTDMQTGSINVSYFAVHEDGTIEEPVVAVEGIQFSSESAEPKSIQVRQADFGYIVDAVQKGAYGGQYYFLGEDGRLLSGLQTVELARGSTGIFHAAAVSWEKGGRNYIGYTKLLVESAEPEKPVIPEKPTPQKPQQQPDTAVDLKETAKASVKTGDPDVVVPCMLWMLASGILACLVWKKK